MKAQVKAGENVDQEEEEPCSIRQLVLIIPTMLMWLVI
jgi:hypothetical protein